MSYKSEYILNSFGRLINKKFSKSLDSVKELKADASDRKIYRLFSGDKSCIGIHNENINENRAFIGFTDVFLKLKFNVPAVFDVSEDELFYLEEDLGDITLHKYSSGKSFGDLKKIYTACLKDLISFQLIAKDKIDYNLCLNSDELDYGIIKHDLTKFYNCFVTDFCHAEFDEDEIKSIIELLNDVISKVQGKYFLYRDFQPRNIMLKNNNLYYIDYQSGMKGPLQYDLVSFLYSGSIELTEEERNELIGFYLTELNKYEKYDDYEFMKYLYYFAFLRLIQVLGSYGHQLSRKNDLNMLNKMNKALEKLSGIKKYITESEIKNVIDKTVIYSNTERINQRKK